MVSVGLLRFEAGGSACQMSDGQQAKLKAWVAATLPRSTRQIGAWVATEFGLAYEGRSGLIALLNRLGLAYHKPEVISRKLDENQQRAFIESYEKLLNALPASEAVLFVDAVHPTHAVRPAGCWAPACGKLAIEQTSGRERINIHGAIDLETGQTRMIEVETVDAISAIRLLQSIERFYPLLALIHVYLACLSGQCALSPRTAGAGLAGPAGLPHQAALPPAILPRISTPSSSTGASCTSTSPTTNATPHAPSSPPSHSTSCAKRFPKTGRNSATGSPTISASFHPKNFGL